jgi:hypothetical protein
VIATPELTLIDAAPHGLWFTHKEQLNALLPQFLGPASVRDLQPGEPVSNLRGVTIKPFRAKETPLFLRLA